MTPFIRIAIAAEIEESIDHLKQMLSCIQDGDIDGASHFMDKAQSSMRLVEEDICSLEE